MSTSQLPLSHGRALPAWPLLGVFWLFPLGWVLGFGTFLPVMFAVLMAALLARHGATQLPRVLLLWALFLLFVVGSAVMIDTTGRMIGLLFRLSNYTAAGVAFLYVFNADSKVVSDKRIGLALTVFWAWVVLGGYLGVHFPEVGLVTPLARVLPGVVADNEIVQAWVAPRFADLQHPWGAPQPYARPSAPFAYANGWGCNFAILTPFVIDTIARSQGRRRLLFGSLLLASAVPAYATLNRGMFALLGFGLAYAAVRSALRGRVAALLGLGLVGASASVGLVVGGVLDQIGERTTYSSTTDDRLALYNETFERALASPILGWGGPRPSRTIAVSVGTQGHIWNVMFSHGFLALVLFLAVLWWLAWRTRGATGTAFAGHISVVIAALAVNVYGFDGPQMMVTMIAAALAMRQVTSPDPPPADGDVAHSPPLAVTG